MVAEDFEFEEVAVAEAVGGNNQRDANLSLVRTTFTLDGWNSAKGPGIGLENFDVWSDHTGGSLTTRYLRGDRVDQLLGRVDTSGATAGRYWNLTDNFGSIRAVLSDSGQVKTAITYDAFGRILTQTNATYRGRYAWTGREIAATSEFRWSTNRP